MAISIRLKILLNDVAIFKFYGKDAKVPLYDLGGLRLLNFKSLVSVDFRT